MTIIDSRGFVDIASHAELPVVTARPNVLRVGGARSQRSSSSPGASRARRTLASHLAVPYGGPHAQRVIAAGGAYLTEQWARRPRVRRCCHRRPGDSRTWPRLGVRGAPRPRRPGARGSSGRTTRPSRTPTTLSTFPASVSEVGRSVAISQHSQCSIVPMSSTPRSPRAPVTDWRLYDTAYTETIPG